MGAVTFMVTEYGANAKEAFEIAVEEAERMSGIGGYTGTIAEKNSFTKIEVPEGKTPDDFAQELIEEDDYRISDKWGPAGCVLLEKGDYKKPETATVDNITKSGRKKWKTVYNIVNHFSSNSEIVDSKDTKTKAIKKAKELAVKNQREYKVKINKKLVSHDDLEAIVRPSELKSNQGAKKNLYLFFGWASS